MQGLGNMRTLRGFDEDHCTDPLASLNPKPLTTGKDSGLSPPKNLLKGSYAFF